MNITNGLQKIQKYFKNGEEINSKPLPSLVDVVEEARRELLNAQYYYTTVSDQDLIDHAVYLMQAAEKKYIYLLKQARNAGVVYSLYTTPANIGINKNEAIIP